MMSKRALGTWRIEQDLVETVARLSKFGRRKAFIKNEILYEQGEVSSRFYFVLKGLVQISIVKADGTEVVLEFMGPHTICGEGAAFDGLPRFSSAIAVENSEAIEFDSSQMGDLFRVHPEFACALMRITSLKQRVLAVRLEHLASREPETRVMELFHRLGEMFATDHKDGRLLATQLTHEQIAAMTGTSRVTITRVLRRLREQGVLDIIDGHVLVKTKREY